MDGKMDLAMAVLAALQVRAVTLTLNGGGDSSECEVERVVYADGGMAAALPRIAIGFDTRGAVELGELVEDLAADIPDGDWVNNEGGHGEVTLYPFEADPDARIDCEMEYGGCDENDEGGFDDEDDETSPSYREADLPADGLLPAICFAGAAHALTTGAVA